MLHHYYIQNVRDDIQIRVYMINKEGVTNFSQFISEKAKKISSSISGKVKIIEAVAK